MDDLAPRGAAQQKCLEVGPGQGHTLRNLRIIGWDAIGVDIDAWAARTAAAVSGCEVRVGTLATVDLPSSSFNLIFMHHVVEHLPDLRPSLQRAFTLLSGGGRLVMVYPNPDSLGARFAPAFSCNWDAPRHLALPPEPAMAALLRDIGFQPVSARTSARNAACYRQRAQKYRAAAEKKAFRDKTTWRDRAFGWIESLCVLMGAPVGEEILVVAHKRAGN
jgi:SAM-dependent methyltransferase